MEAASAQPKVKRRLHPAIPFMAAILVIVGVLVGLVVFKQKETDPGPPLVNANAPAPVQDEKSRLRYLREGWKQDASATLGGFLAAATLEEKAQYVLGGAARLEEMRAFYGDQNEVSDEDTPLETFSHADLDIMDHRRGLFLMRFERPDQYKLGEFFRPVMPLAVQHGIEDPDLLQSAFASRENFTMEPLRVMAFFKQIDGELFLDWDLFVQTKYRTLRHFLTYPQPGVSRNFRVMVEEVLPARSDLDLSKYRYYRVSDPARRADKFDVPVGGESLQGRILSELAWINLPGRPAQRRYATVRLAWTEEEDPRVFMEKVICWEFLGLGGEEGNADPIGESIPDELPAEIEALESDPLGPEPPAPGAAPEPVSVEEEISGEGSGEPAESVETPTP